MQTCSKTISFAVRALIFSYASLMLSMLGCKKTNDNSNIADNSSTLNQSLQPPAIPPEPMVIAGQTFQIELAYTRHARQQGLMFRSELSGDHGMMFIFAQPGPKSFYMKNCLIDLDLIYLDEQGHILSIKNMQAPKSGEPLQYYPSGESVKYAIELPAGAASKLKLAPGQTLALPDRVKRILPEPD